MRLLAVLGLVLLTTGCELEFRVGVDLDAEGGGDVRVLLSADRELSAAAASVGVDPLGRLSERIAAIGDPWSAATVSDPADTAGTTVEVAAAFDGPEEFGLRWEELRQALDAPEANLLGPMSLTVDEETDIVRLTGMVPFTVTEVAASDVGLTVEELQAQMDGVVRSGLFVTTPVPDEAGARPGMALTDDPEGPHEYGVVPVLGQPPQAVDITYLRPGFDLAGLLTTVGIGLLAVLVIGGGVVAQRRR